MATFSNLETTVEPLAGLMRDHIETHALVEAAREALLDARNHPADQTRMANATDALLDLDAHLAVDLPLHIAKEEQVLFPALLGLSGPMDKVVDEMVEQHDEVRLRRDNVERALRLLEADHERVEACQLEVVAGISQARIGGLDASGVEKMLDAVNRLDWILRGHFGDEEDDLFVPALEMLQSETWQELDTQARQLEESYSA